MPDITNMDREGVPVEQLMSSDMITVTPNTHVEEAVDILIEENIGSLVIVDDEEELAGVITSNDFLHVVSEANFDDNATVNKFMSDQVKTVNPDDSIQTAAARMITNGISHLPVEDEENEVVGMLSTTDVTAYSVSRA